MYNEVFFKGDSYHGMKKGLDIGANAVKVTLGYGGRTVFIYKKGLKLVATKDGVTVINSIRLKDNLQDAGLKHIQDVSSNTATIVGDGTTTVCVLMQEIISNGIKYIESGVDIAELKKGMERAANSIVGSIQHSRKSVNGNSKLLRQIATVSANNDKSIGDIVGDIFDKIGQYGHVRIEDGTLPATTIEMVKGFQFLGGIVSHHFINTKDNTSEQSYPYVLIVDGKIDKPSQIMPVLEMAVNNGRAIVIMADDYDNEVVATVLANANGKAKLKATLIKHAFSGETKDELLADLCAICGATLITEKLGKRVENIDLSYLGECEGISSGKDETSIINGKRNDKAVSLRIHDAKKKIEKSKNEFVRERYQVRLGKLDGLIAICYVGGVTDVEREEKKARVDDAVRATKAAAEEGIVAGAGTSLIRACKNLSSLTYDTDSERMGIELIQKSIEKPLFQIAENSGKNGSLIVGKVSEKSGSIGYNAKSGKVEDLLKAGIIDPAKVVRVCVENSISGAIQFLMSSCAITELNND